MSTILIADDDDHIRTILRAALISEGMRCIEARDAEAADRLLQRHLVHLLAVNYPMRFWDGVTLTRKVRSNAELSNVKIVNLTARDNVGTSASAHTEGVDYTLPRSVNSRAVVEIIKAVLDVTASGEQLGDR